MIQKNTEHWWVSHVFHQVTLQLVRLLPTPPSHHVGKFRMPPLLARGKQCSALTLGLTQKKKTSSSKRSLSYNCSSLQADQPTFVHAGMADFTYWLSRVQTRSCRALKAAKIASEHSTERTIRGTDCTTQLSVPKRAVGSVFFRSGLFAAS